MSEIKNFKVEPPMSIKPIEICTVFNSNMIPFSVSVRPKQVALSEFIDVKPSESLTIFTYKVQKGFSKVIQENIKLCKGVVDIIADVDKVSNEKDPDYKSISKSFCGQLVELNKGPDIKLYYVLDSHIKLIIRDDEIILGSQNFGISGDFGVTNELIFKSNSGGEVLKEEIMNLMENIEPDFNPIIISRLDSEMLRDKITEKFCKAKDEKNEKAKSWYNSINENFHTLVKSEIHRKIKSISFEKFHDLFYEAINEIEHNVSYCEERYIDSLILKYKDVIECKLNSLIYDIECLIIKANDDIEISILDKIHGKYKRVIDDINDALENEMEDKKILLSDLVDECSIDDEALTRAEQAFCSEGWSNPKTGEFDPKAVDTKTLIDRKNSLINDIKQKNKELLNNYFEELDESFSKIVEKIMNPDS